ncbi:MAG: PhnD/SsuA/transferrin family substrate-binding protein [Planctomycetia bacterium]|nr:PhnD/SsuA/transferrin family substrate-binding protein [Planctomycetia bacterium]
MALLLLFGALFFQALPTWAQQESVEVRIGVLAFRGHQQAMSRWQPMADYLNANLYGIHFTIVPLNLQQVRKATAAEEIDFVLTNPGNYVLLESRYGASRIATLKRHWLGHDYSRFGAVVFTRRDNPDIKSLKDLKGRSLMIVNNHAFGGFQMAWRELKEAGVDPFKDIAELKFNGFPQDNIVHAVMSGQVDAGTIRTGILENMALNGKVELDKIRVLENRNVEGFQFLLSTRLYPEWPLAKLKHTPDELASKLVVALLSAPKGAFSLSGTDWVSWTIPLDYSNVNELMRELSIGPYLPDAQLSLSKTIKEYAYWLIMILAVLFGLALLSIYVLRVNRRLVDTQHVLQDEIAERVVAQEKLNENKRFLEQRVVERTASLAELNAALQHSEITLRELNRIVSVFPVPLEEKIRALIELGRKHFGFSSASLYRRNEDGISVVLMVGTEPGAAAADDTTVFMGGIGIDEFDEMLQDDEVLLAEKLFQIDGKVEGEVDLLSCVAVKVLVEGKPFGFLCLADDQDVSRNLGEVDRDILQLIADWLGMEIARKQVGDREQQHLSDLAHVTRLSTMGEMASGLAHELNQPLTAIANYLRGCQRRIDRGNLEVTELTAIMQQSIQEAERAAKIIRRMRAFVNKEDPHHERVDINELITRVSGFLRSEMERKSITLTLSLAENLPVLIVDAIQIEQVLLNLLRNAIDAVHVPWQGEKMIEVVSSMTQTDMLNIEVRDTGVGLPDGERQQIFDPFYTTKDEGMGMGLSISRTIIEAHGGTMYTDTSGQHTIVGLALPQPGDR